MCIEIKVKMRTVGNSFWMTQNGIVGLWFAFFQKYNSWISAQIIGNARRFWKAIFLFTRKHFSFFLDSKDNRLTNLLQDPITPTYFREMSHDFGIWLTTPHLESCESIILYFVFMGSLLGNWERLLQPFLPDTSWNWSLLCVISKECDRLERI